MEREPARSAARHGRGGPVRTGPPRAEETNAGRDPHGVRPRLGRYGYGRSGNASRAVAGVDRLRSDRVRFRRAAGLAGAARVRVRAADVRRARFAAGPTIDDRAVPGLRARARDAGLA